MKGELIVWPVAETSCNGSGVFKCLNNVNYHKLISGGSIKTSLKHK